MVEVSSRHLAAGLSKPDQERGRVGAAGKRDEDPCAGREKRGGGGWDRTSDAAVMSRVLYH